MAVDRKWQVFFLVAVSIFMSTLDSSIVNVALPYIMTDLKEDMGAVQWVVVIYLLTVSSLLLVFGRLSDIKGRPMIYRAGFSIFTLGSLFCALSPNVNWLIASRAVQGVGASMLMACSPALIVDVFEPENRGQGLGLVGASMLMACSPALIVDVFEPENRGQGLGLVGACVALGLTCGPLAGGLLLAWFSWRSIFFINLPVGAAALAYAAVILKEKGESLDEPVDWKGAGLLAVFLGGLILAIAKTPAWGLISFKGAACLGLALLAAGLWTRHARTTSFPLFNPKLLRTPGMSLPLGAALCLFAALFFLVFLMPFYLSLACGFAPATTGMVMIAPFIFLLVVSPAAGALSDRLGTKGFCGWGLACLALSLFLLGRLTPDQGVVQILWRLALAGIGTAMFISPNSTAVMGAVLPGQRGTASGALATARNLGMVLGVSLSGTIFSFSFSRLTGGHGLDAFVPAFTPFFLTAFGHAMTAGSLVALGGLALTLARPESKPPNPNR